MVLGLAFPEQQHWFHADFLPVIGGILDVLTEVTGVYNGHKHHKWYKYD